MSIVTGVILIANSPSTVEYSIGSTGEKGLSRLLNHYTGSIVIYDLDEIERYGEGYVLILARTRSVNDISRVNSFVEKGGVVLAYGSPEYVLTLLNALGVNARFAGYVMSGGIYHGDKYSIVVDLYGDEAVFRKAFLIDGLRGGNESTVVWCKYVSFVDLNGNELYDLGEPVGIYPLGLELKVGRGKYMILFTESFLENGVFDHNNFFLERKFDIKPSHLIIDQSEHASNILEYLRLIMLTRTSPLFVYSSIVIIAVLTVISYYVNKER